MKKYTFMALFLLLVMAAGKASAQGCAPENTGDGINLFGFIQPQYTRNFNAITQSAVNFERARLGVNGNVPYDFAYYAVLEISPFMGTNPYLLDAFITYNRYQWARISLGQFKTPFGLETNTPCSGLLTAYRSTATLQMVAPFRDLGAVVMGGNETTRFAYQVGMMNGSGIGRSDNNQSKDLVSRLVFRPLDFLSLGGSFRYGFPSYNNNDASRTTFGLELQARYAGLTLKGEYIADEGDYNRDLGGGCAGNLIELGQKRSGGYATLGYMTQWNIEPVVSFDFFDSGNLQQYKETNMTMGLNYFFNDWTRLQLNYVYKAERPLEIKNDIFVVQLQVMF